MAGLGLLVVSLHQRYQNLGKLYIVHCFLKLTPSGVIFPMHIKGAMHCYEAI